MTNRLYSVPLILVLLCAYVSAFAQEPQTPFLSSEDAVRAMLTNNFGIQIANNNVGVADNNTSILNSDYLPTVFGQAGANFDRTTSTTDFNGALDNDGNARPNVVIPDAETVRYDASINASYTLFDGLGRFYNYKQLKEQYNLSQLEARETIENTMVQLFSVYYEVARIEENIAVFETALEISRKRETRAQYQFDYGQVNKLQILNAQVDIVTDSINLLNAKQQLRNTQRDLNVVLAAPLENLKTADTTVAFVSPLLIDSYVEQASVNNVNLLQVEQDIIISDYEIKKAKGLFLPTIGLTGSYGWNLANNPASAFFPGTTRSSTSLAAGASLSWNIFDGGRSIVGLKNARIALDSQKLIKEQLKQQVYRDIANAKGNYQNALMVFRLQEQNVITSEANFERSSEQFKLGQVSSVEFRQAQLNLLNAQTTKNAAKYTAKLAEIQLLQLTGQLLNVDF
ncbi:TolC family protein [Dokdonia sp. 4H-3-7-5]|uniref:TolC family protein n=1 Tax=Dokdonia sp. (strain 4H-3-7-5) TaxID=983548 RepID=UPI00020A6F75|nr:TolC family protein [Dokdonia sp. 4H-3-7-5]AEE19674.1 outer membrane efflux protein [Dokdonia sp. 4H-3-7-5]